MFEAWQLEKLRTRLLAYCTEEATANRDLHLKDVIRRMEKCPAIGQEFYTSDGQILCPYEPLRKFIRQKSKPRDERLFKILEIFLTHVGYLIAEELSDEAEDHGETLAIYGYLGKSGPQAAELINNFRGDYFHDARDDPEIERITLKVSAHSQQGLCRVVEECQPRSNTATKRGRSSVGVRTRLGYGFISTNLNLIHIFVKGAYDTDRIHYIEISLGSSSSLFKKVFVRAGGISPSAAAVQNDQGLSITFRSAWPAPSSNSQQQQQQQQQQHQDWWDREKEQAPQPAPFQTYERYTHTETAVAPSAVQYQQQTQYQQQALGSGQRAAEQPASEQWKEMLGRSLLNAIPDNKIHVVASSVRMAEINVNVQDEQGATPLHRAASIGNRACVRLLISSGRCDYLIQDKYGRYASELALTWGGDYPLAIWIVRKQIAQAKQQGRRAWQLPQH